MDTITVILEILQFFNLFDNNKYIKKHKREYKNKFKNPKSFRKIKNIDNEIKNKKIEKDISFKKTLILNPFTPQIYEYQNYKYFHRQG